MNRRLIFPVALVLATAGCANMGTGPGSNPTQLRLQALEQRTDKLDRQISNIDLAKLGNQLNDTQAQIRELRGQVEQLNFQIEANKRRIRDLYQDLDRRVGTLESRAGISSSTQPGGGESGASSQQSVTNGKEAPVAPSDAERQAYLSAFNQLKSGNYDKAAAAFNGFLQKYPASSFADNALYWMSEAEYVNGHYDKAMGDFKKLESKYPKSDKIPGSLLKIGYIQYEQKHYDQAKKTLNGLKKQYPDSTAASLADQRLKRMQQEGK